MSLPTYEELLLLPVDDSEILARRRHILQVLLEMWPDIKQKLIANMFQKSIEDGRLLQTRIALRRVLARRQLTLSKDDEARIEACTDLATLQRWFDRAIVAVSAADALE